MRTLAGTSDTRPTLDQASSIPPDEGRRRRTLLTQAAAGALLGLGVFLAIQTALAVYEVHVIRDALERGEMRGYPGLSLAAEVVGTALAGGVAYLVLAIVGTAIAIGGHRLLFALPAGTYILVRCVEHGHQPEAIGVAWQISCFSDTFDCSGPWFVNPWVGATVDLALVLLPGLLVAVRVSGRRWPGRLDAPAAASLLVAVIAVVVAGWAIAVVENGLDLRAIAVAGVSAILLGSSRPWWPWLHVLVAGLASGAFWGLIDMVLHPEPSFPLWFQFRYLLEALWPILAVTFLAGAWPMLARLFRRTLERPIWLLAGVTALNLADAVLTELAVRSGDAIESNPVIRVIGLPAKLVLGALLTWVLYRRRPSSLVWPAAALLGVACYHVGGMFVNAWR